MEELIIRKGITTNLPETTQQNDIYITSDGGGIYIGDSNQNKVIKVAVGVNDIANLNIDGGYY